MPAISINVDQVQQLRAVVATRAADVREASSRVRRAMDGLVLDSTDPNAGGVPAHLDRLQSHLARIADQLDTERGDIDRFVQRITWLDSNLLCSYLPVPWPRFKWRLGPFCVALNTGARTGFHAITDGLTRLGKPVLNAVKRVEYRVKDSFKRYVGDPLNRFKHFIKRGWRNVTSAFRKAWDAAWIQFSRIATDIARLGKMVFKTTVKVVKKVINLGKTVYKIVADQLAVVMFTKFDTINHAPNAQWTKETNFKGTIKVNIPLEEFGFPGDLVVGAAESIDIKYFDDGTAEVTFTQEFMAGLKADLMKKGVSADLIETLGGEMTFLVKTGSIHGQDAVQLFIKQQISRIILMSLAANLESPMSIAAQLLLKAMAPPPVPLSTSAYYELKAEINLDLPHVIKAGVSGAIEERITANRDGTTVVSFKQTFEAAAGGALFGVLDMGGTDQVSVTYSIEYDEKGIPSAVEIEGSFEQLTSAGGSKAGPVAGGSSAPGGDASASIGTEHILTKRIEFGEADRNKIAQLVKAGDIGGVLAVLDELAHRVPTTSETIDVLKGEVNIDAGVAEGSVEVENRVRQSSPAAAGGTGW